MGNINQDTIKVREFTSLAAVKIITLLCLDKQ